MIKAVASDFSKVLLYRRDNTEAGNLSKIV